MATKRYSISIREDDTRKVKMMDKLKDECAAHGVNFSFVVVKAVELLVETERRAKTKESGNG